MEKKMLLLGPQGCGKGTQGDMIAARLGIPRVSTGDIMRREIGRDTEFGRLIASYINEGKLLPDDLTNKIVDNRLEEEDCEKGFILDGYPRNMAQALLFDQEYRLDRVILISIPEGETVRRLAGRRVCRCGASFHIKANPPIKEGICDSCGEALFQREDDREEAIRQRLKIYHEATEPLAEFYRARGILKEVDGTGSISAVFDDILEKIG